MLCLSPQKDHHSAPPQELQKRQLQRKSRMQRAATAAKERSCHSAHMPVSSTLSS
jgi:hypothetical protein